MQSCNITSEIIEAVAGSFSCGIEVNSVEFFHNIDMIGNFKVRGKGFAELFDLDVFGIVLADRNRKVNDVWDNHHDFFDLLFKFSFFKFEGINFLIDRSNFSHNCLKSGVIFGRFLSLFVN